MTTDNVDKHYRMAWASAVESLLESPGISDDDREQLLHFKAMDPDEAKKASDQAFQEFRNDSKFHKTMEVVRPLVDGLDSVGSYITTLSTMDPHGIASLVWGAVQLLLKVCRPLSAPATRAH